MKIKFEMLKSKNINYLLMITYILNILVISCIIIYSTLFYFEKNLLYLRYIILILSFTTLSLKLIYWYLIEKIKRISELSDRKNKSKLFLLRISLCIFTYLTPTSYIFKQGKLVINNDIVLTTLIIISIIASIGIIIEKYLFNIESKFEKNLINIQKFI